MKTLTKKEFINYLNELEIPNHDKKSNGGRIPNHAKYDSWLYKNDPIAFNCAYSDFVGR